MASHNMTWLSYPSKSFASTSPEEIEAFIASQNIISRLMHCYIAFFVPMGLISGICILIIFIKNYLQHKTKEQLDLLLLHFTISNIIMIFLSFTVIPRPDYLKATHLACSVLSFFFNFSYFNSQYVLIFILLILLLERFLPRTALSKATQNPVSCVAFVLIYTFCLSLTEAVLLGMDNYHVETECQSDPLFAWPEYEIVKFTFGFAIPAFLQVLSFTVLFAKKAPAEAQDLRQHIRTYAAVFIISITIFICHLFYNIMILFRTTLKLQKSIGTPKNELMMNIAEIVLFSESCANLVFILCFHKPCKDRILEVIHNCRRRNTTHNHLEIPVVSTTPERTPQ
ncbi:C-X-C chemokine receptor type 1-like [Anser cygnoides]|uniref:C-X-C chemokine receptor type 1-like n=1 Tax=Anser cygnoides TaxID=8845 RepID=UPI0034D1D971